MPDNVQYTFDNGSLVVRDTYCCTRIQWGETPVASEQLGNGEFKEGDPYHRILVPPGINAGVNREALNAFADLVSPQVFRIVSPFASHQWMLMKLLALNPYSLDLAVSNPILAYCLANNFQFRKIHRLDAAWEQANMYTRRKQKLILHWLGFPSTGIVVKLMKKINTSEMSVALLRLLRVALEADNPTLRLLSHYPSITPGMLGLLRPKIIHLVTAQLVSDVADDQQECLYPHTADRLTRIQLMEKAGSDIIRIPPFQSIRSVREFNDRIETEFRDRMQKLHQIQIEQEELLGTPPLEGTDNIVPISTISGLLAEGKEMRNCVASYIHKIKNGEIYIYKVLSPERATMSISQRFDGSWYYVELKLKRNKAVSWKTQTEVNAWLKSHST